MQVTLERCSMLNSKNTWHNLCLIYQEQNSENCINLLKKDIGLK